MSPAVPCVRVGTSLQVVVVGRCRRRGRRRQLQCVARQYGAVPALPRPKRPPEARKRAPVVPFGRTEALKLPSNTDNYPLFAYRLIELLGQEERRTSHMLR